MQTSDPRKLSLARAKGSADWYERVYLYGPLVLLRVLRGRIGDQAFREGLQLVVERHGGGTFDTAQLRDAFEEASGSDLEDMFRFWVEAGRLPKLAGRYRLVAEGPDRIWLRGQLNSDVAAGTIEVPLRVVSVEGSRDILVALRDGRGSFQAGPFASMDVSVLLDPDHLLIARGREMKLGEDAPGAP